MATDMFYDLNFEATAAQKVTLTVLGESNAAKSPDDVIEVSVTAAEMAGLLAVQSGWQAPQDGRFVAGEQPYPDLTLSFSGVSSKITAVDTKLRVFTDAAGVVATDCVFGPEGDILSTDNKNLQSYFLSKVFDYSADADKDLLSIPPEAIKLVEQADLTGVSVLATVLSDGAGAQVPYNDPMTSDLDRKKSIRALFEQAVGASKWKSNAVADGGVSTGGAWEFVPNDSMTFYINYSLTKTRTYKPDADVLSLTSGAARFKIPGSGVELTGETDVDGIASALIALKFKVVA
jgi:hypothetical protein